MSASIVAPVGGLRRGIVLGLLPIVSLLAYLTRLSSLDMEDCSSDPYDGTAALFRLSAFLIGRGRVASALT